jgi:predicted Zn-dependent protease
MKRKIEVDIDYYLKASEYFSNGKYHDALTAIEQALRIAPDDVSGLRLHSKILLQLNRPSEARVATEHALHIEPENIFSLRAQAKIMLQLNRPDEALVAIEQAVRLEPDNVAGLFLYTQILLKFNRLNEALAAIEQALRIAAHDFILRDHAQILFQLKRSNEALVSIEQALRIDPDNDFCLRLHAQILLQLKRPDEALVAIEKVLRIEPDNDFGLRLHAQILLQLNRPNEALVSIEQALRIEPDNVFDLRTKAKILRQLNRSGEALVAIEKVLRIEPDNAFGLALYAQILLELNRANEAEVTIEHALRIAPDNDSYLFVHAQILMQLNRSNEALVTIEHALNKAPDNFPYLCVHAQILLQLNRSNEALVVIEQALRLAPDDGFGLCVYAQILLQLNRSNEALVAIELALGLEPDNDFGLCVHAQILIRINRSNEALVAIEHALRLAPDKILGLCLHAQILHQLNRANEALLAIEHALSIAPDTPLHLCVHAQILLELNKANEALVAIEHALSIDPDNDSYLCINAQILLQLNRSNEALVAIEHALRLAPDNDFGLRLHAEVFLQLDRVNEAEVAIEHALRLAPDNNIGLNLHAQILTKKMELQAIKSHEECINNTFISKKYFNASIPSLPNSRDKDHRTPRNHTLLCKFEQLKDCEHGDSPQGLKPIVLNIHKSTFTYYTKEPMLPSSTTPCIFIMAGRQLNAAIPASIPAPNRIILVITEDELNRLYLARNNEELPTILLPERTDLLVINHLESHTYGIYDRTTLINARRVAALCVAVDLQLNDLMLMDDNIQELNCANGTLSQFNQLWAMHRPNQLISSIVTSSNRTFNSGDKNKLGSKLFMINAVQLQQAFNFIKPEELAFFLFLPPHCSNLVMEDYYFQLLINKLCLNNSSLKGHVALDEQTISLTRSSANKNTAKKNTNEFGVFAWLSLNKRTFVTDSLAEKLSANSNSKELISSLVNGVVNDIKSIITNNLQQANEYISECKTVTMQKVKSGSKENNKSLNKQQLWELIKYSPDLNLRLPQIKGIELWIKENRSDYLHSYSIATGVGKTHIKAIMAYLELACTEQPVIVVTADQKLVDNLTEKFSSIFKQLNAITQLNLSPDMIKPVMSSGNKAISQGLLAISDGFKVKQNLYVFCEDSFLKLIQERKVNISHSSLILLDEYHCYTKTLDAAIKAVQSYVVYAGQINEGTCCYCIDVHQDCISLFDADGTRHLLDLELSLIFNGMQREEMRRYINPVKLSDSSILNRLQAALQQVQQKIPFPTVHRDNTREIPFYWGNELPATTIKLVEDLPAVMPNERITYITPTGIYQTNQTGITLRVVTQDELVNYWRTQWSMKRDYLNEQLQSQEQVIQSMFEYFTLSINEYDFKRELNELIIKNRGLPCLDLEELRQSASPECFILTNVPPQLIYKNQNGKEQEIASGFDLYQIWGFEQMKEKKSYFEKIAFHPNIDLDKIAALNQLCLNKQLASFPSIIKESSTNIIGFSATPPKQNPLKCVFTYSKETAEFMGYITPSIVRLINISNFKNIPYQDIFTNVLTMNGPEGAKLCDRKGLYRFKSINELKKAEQILKDTYKDLSISSVHTPKGNEYNYDEKKILKDFSAIAYNKGAILLIVSKLQKGWDEPRLSYTVDFKKNPGINSAIQFLGRATRVCYDEKDQQPIAKNKIGLGFFPTSAAYVKKHLELLKEPLPQNKKISIFYSSEKRGCIEAGDYNLNSQQIAKG